MASGTGTRSLPDPADERSLLGLDGTLSLKTLIPASKTATFAFPSSGPQDGILAFAAGSSAKRGMYIYGCTTAGSIVITTILAPTQSGLSVSGSGRNLVLVNGTADLYACIISFQGSLPTVTIA